MKAPFLRLAAVLMAGCLVQSASGQTPWSVVYDSDRPLNAVAYGGGQFIAVGDSGIVLTSPTGEDWTSRTSAGPADTLQCVVHGDGLWVVGGRTTGILVASDGIRWARVPGSPADLTALVHGAGVFVGTGNGSLWASTNGVHWNSINPGGFVADRVLSWGGGQFVALATVKGSSRILTSTNGVDWISGSPTPERGLYHIGYGAGMFLGISTSANRAYASSDLETWTPGGITRVVRTAGIAYGQGTFVIVGGGDPEMSVDGSSWSPGGAVGPGPFRAVAFADGAFVAVGYAGSILRSGRLLTVDTQAPGNLSVLGPGGGRYGIEARDSLADGTGWAPVGEVTVATNAVTWSDPDTSSHPARWYRAVGP